MKRDLILSTRVHEDRSSIGERSIESALLALHDLGHTEFEVHLPPGETPGDGVFASLAAQGLRVRCVQRPYPLEWSAHLAHRLAAAAGGTTPEQRWQKATTDAIELGNAALLLGCDVLLVSLGSIDGVSGALRENEILHRLESGTPPDEKARTELLALKLEAALHAGVSVERACRSLHEIAKRLPDRRIGLLGGLFPTDLADPERLQWILGDLRAAPLFYWHHTGFAEAQRFLGLAEPGEWLDRHSRRLLGVTLHDAAGLKFHLVPGRGAVDFRILRDYVSARTLRVLELAPGDVEAIPEARRFLEKEGLA